MGFSISYYEQLFAPASQIESSAAYVCNIISLN